MLSCRCSFSHWSSSCWKSCMLLDTTPDLEAGRSSRAALELDAAAPGGGLSRWRPVMVSVGNVWHRDDECSEDREPSGWPSGGMPPRVLERLSA